MDSIHDRFIPPVPFFFKQTQSKIWSGLRQGANGDQFAKAFGEREVDIFFAHGFFNNFCIMAGSEVFENLLHNIFRRTGAGCDQNRRNTLQPLRVNLFNAVNKLRVGPYAERDLGETLAV